VFYVRATRPPVYESEERLYLLPRTCKGSRNTGLKLSCCFRTVTPCKFVLTGRKYERLLRAKAPFLCGQAHPVSKLLAGEEQIPFGSLFHHRITSILVGGTFVAQSSRNTPPAISLISKTLVPKSREASPHSFMFQYPPNRLQHARSSCLHLSLSVAFCLQLFPVVAFRSFFVANCLQLSLVFVAFCGLLLLLVASCGLLRLFVASSRTVAICRECLRLSQSVPSCPRVSDSVRFCPGNNFFNSEAQRRTKFFLTFSCFEVP